MSNKYSLPEDGGAIEKTALQDIIHRYEKISTQVFPAETDGVRYVADRIVRAIADYEKSGPTSSKAAITASAGSSSTASTSSPTTSICPTVPSPRSVFPITAPPTRLPSAKST